MTHQHAAPTQTTPEVGGRGLHTSLVTMGKRHVAAEIGTRLLAVELSYPVGWCPQTYGGLAVERVERVACLHAATLPGLSPAHAMLKDRGHKGRQANQDDQTSDSLCPYVDRGRWTTNTNRRPCCGPCAVLILLMLGKYLAL